MAWKRADVKAARRATAWGDRTERWAMAWERVYDLVAEWTEATEIGGITLAQRLGITVPRTARSPQADAGVADKLRVVMRPRPRIEKVVTAG
jgi:hypothetical protein